MGVPPRIGRPRSDDLWCRATGGLPGRNARVRAASRGVTLRHSLKVVKAPEGEAFQPKLRVARSPTSTRRAPGPLRNGSVGGRPLRCARAPAAQEIGLGVE